MLKHFLTGSALAAMLLIGASSASAQTNATPPGAPNTGEGGAAAANILILAASALAIIGGTAYLARKVGESR